MNPNILSDKLKDQYFSQAAKKIAGQSVTKIDWIHKEVSERSLVEDCLLLLSGGTSTYFEEDPITNQFIPSKAVEVTHLSTGSLKRQLEQICQFHSYQHKIGMKVKNLESYQGVVIRRLTIAIKQVHTELLSEISYLQVIFGVQNGK